MDPHRPKVRIAHFVERGTRQEAQYLVVIRRSIDPLHEAVELELVSFVFGSCHRGLRRSELVPHSDEYSADTLSAELQLSRFEGVNRVGSR
jgi:hypothetical protein